MISIGYKDCRGCKGGIHHSFKQKTLTQMGSTRVVVVTSVGMKMESVRMYTMRGVTDLSKTYPMKHA